MDNLDQRLSRFAGVQSTHRPSLTDSTTATESNRDSPAVMGADMSETDMEYFRQRAAREREMARKARTPKIAAIHEELARGYDLLIKEPQERSGVLL